MSRTTDVLALTERTLEPMRLDRELADFDIDGCRERFLALRGPAVAVLIATVICIGRAMEKAGWGQKAADSIGPQFSMSRSLVYRLSKVYREIVRPRIEQLGDAAVFSLEETSFYVLSVEAAPKLEMPAVEVLEHAEIQREANPSYAVAEFKDWIDERKTNPDEGSTSSDAKSIDRALGKIAEGDMADYAAWAAARKDAREKLNRAKDALTAINDAIEELRGRGVATNGEAAA